MSSATGSPIRVVIADDDRAIREVLGEWVDTTEGLELVGVAATGEEALHVCSAQTPDVVIMDVRMPGIGGIGAVTRLKHASPRSRVVAFSAYADRAAGAEMLGAGAVAYVIRGATVDEMLEAVQRAGRSEPPLSPAVTRAVLEEVRDRGGRERLAVRERQPRLRRIHHALDRGIGTVFQPIIDISEGRPVGFEALARFTADPHQPPDVWSATAADVDLGVDLELAVLCAALRQFPLLPPPAYMSVNLGPATMTSPRLATALLGAPLERVVLELTEHARIDDYDLIMASLNPLREQGVRLAIDDAGAGFASLRHVLLLDPDIIKLDVSLTRGIDTDRPRRALARGLVSFGREVGATLVGEGVESASELAALRRLGVACAQGYYLGRPAALEGTGPAGFAGEGSGGDRTRRRSSLGDRITQL